MHRLTLLVAALGAMVPSAYAEPGRSNSPSAKPRLYISTYGTDRDGLYLAELDPTSGELRLIGLAGALKNVQFFAFHPNKRFLYATCDVDDYPDTKGGAVTSFKIDAPTASLTRLNHQSSAGALPCHISVDREGKYALVANYDGGTVAVLPIRADGTLGPATSTVTHHGSSIDKLNQTGPHPHAINFDPTNRFVFVADLGIDQVLSYRFDAAAGTLAQNDPHALAVAPGAGPRHLAFHPNGKWVYVINELDSTVTALRYDSKPAFSR
jgi:6-phosphogluconolactonase